MTRDYKFNGISIEIPKDISGLFDVLDYKEDGKTLSAVKALRVITGWGLKESLDFTKHPQIKELYDALKEEYPEELL